MRHRRGFTLIELLVVISIIGGLLLSQLLTLYTTPVIYLYFDRLARRLSRYHVGNEIPAETPAD